MMRFGIVGVGTHARWAVIDAIARTSKKCQLVAACDLYPENIKDLAEKGIAVFGNLDEMIKTVQLDALYISTTSNAHYDATISAFRAGLHVICEKPMADSIEKCEDMIREAEKADRKLAITFENRYHPEIRKIKEWIDAGFLGKVGAIHTHLFTSNYKTFGPRWERRKRLLDLAGVLDCGIHALDYIRYLLNGEWIELHSRGAWFGETLTNAPHISILGRISSGAIATITYSYSYAAYIEGNASNKMLTIVGTDGIVDWHMSNNEAHVLHLISRNCTEDFHFENTDHSLAIGWLADDFADYIEGKKSWPPELATGHDGLVAQKLMEEALSQARTHRVPDVQVHSCLGKNQHRNSVKRAGCS